MRAFEHCCPGRKAGRFLTWFKNSSRPNHFQFSVGGAPVGGRHWAIKEKPCDSAVIPGPTEAGRFLRTRPGSTRCPDFVNSGRRGLAHPGLRQHSPSVAQKWQARTPRCPVGLSARSCSWAFCREGKLDEVSKDQAVRCQHAGSLTTELGLSEVVQGNTYFDLGQDQDSGAASNPGHIVENMLRMVDGPVLHRFCSTRKLDQYETGVAVFVQDLSIRDPNSTQVFQGLLDFQGNTAWQLIRVQYRRESAAEAFGRHVMQALRFHNVGTIAMPMHGAGLCSG